ncbi:MAG: zinc-dependent dehydrogenase [Bryobacterales bacterium]|nr:zinc-dependent dehydrogenase [Bryobacterales bacterium]
MPRTMKAAVYVAPGRVEIQEVPVPEVGPGELLLRVEACGICHTDLKKIAYGLLPPPRIFGHETAGVIVRTGPGVEGFRAGERVVVFHHIPCEECFYCRRRLYAQCPVYKRVGVTAGFEPAGGGFAQYTRVLPWIVPRGVERIPEGVAFEQASMVEPVNTCHKAIEQLDPQPGDLVLVMGQGPIGLLFTLLARLRGARVAATERLPYRRLLSRELGAEHCWDPVGEDVPARVRQLSGGRGADSVIVAVSAPGIVEQAVAASRPGSRILLFSQTSHEEKVVLPGAEICVAERTIFGCYSASIELQRESARMVFEGTLPVERLISHRLPLEQIGEGIRLALHPEERSLKIVVRPQA